MILVWNVGFVVALVYSVFYVSLDLKAGSLAALLCGFCWVGSSIAASQLGLSLAWKVVLVIQIVCWTGQFIGHGVFEKRAPALLDNLIQAFVMAPFFVLLEVLYLQILFSQILFSFCMVFYPSLVLVYCLNIYIYVYLRGYLFNVGSTIFIWL